MSTSLLFFQILGFFVVLINQTHGHGMVLDPPNRSSLWRFDPTSPVNYEDDENYCGGFGMQWNTNGGKCGACGDNYADPVPRDNENTGKYGEGKIVAEYEAGSVVNVSVLLTTNHWGWFSYSLCELKDATKPEEEECFEPLKFADGADRVKIKYEQKYFYDLIRLPERFVCERCVLRWHYKTANSWGICEDGSGGLGCGPQEVFRSCSDISIY